MTGYNFKPMLAVYGRLVAAETDWLMSPDARRLIAKSIRLCRKFHGRTRAIEFRDALVYVGCLYPIVRY